MSHNPPQLGDFDGDFLTHEKCLDAYNLGWLAFNENKVPEDNPYPDKTDENWFWLEGLHHNRENMWP